jgi:hypothetical protein
MSLTERRKASEDAVLKRTQNKRKSNRSRIKRLEEAGAPFEMIRPLKKKDKIISKFQDKILDPKKKTIEMTKEYKETIPEAMGGYKGGGKVCKLATKGKGRAYGKNS